MRRSTRLRPLWAILARRRLFGDSLRVRSSSVDCCRSRPPLTRCFDICQHQMSKDSPRLAPPPKSGGSSGNCCSPTRSHITITREREKTSWPRDPTGESHAVPTFFNRTSELTSKFSTYLMSGGGNPLRWSKGHSGVYLERVILNLFDVESVLN